MRVELRGVAGIAREGIMWVDSSARAYDSCVRNLAGPRACGNLVHVLWLRRAVRVCGVVDTCQCALSAIATFLSASTASPGSKSCKVVFE